MDSISSAKFRLTYAKLTEPTVVTANGHVIGTWMPRDTVAFLSAPRTQDDGVERHVVRIAEPADRFNTRPFRPVPKKGK